MDLTFVRAAILIKSGREVVAVEPRTDDYDPFFQVLGRCTMSRINLLQSITAVVLAASIVGCGKHDKWERVVVSGVVTYQGQPVEKGQIRFIPVKGPGGPVTVDPIDEGKYSTKNTAGVPIGTHRVEILGYDAKQYAAASTGPGAPPVPQLLPKKYNLQSELTETLDTTQSEKTLDFNLSP
ncbi:MAG: hypothetical protein ABIU95_03170 [Burkholderiales bacterium]